MKPLPSHLRLFRTHPPSPSTPYICASCTQNSSRSSRTYSSSQSPPSHIPEKSFAYLPTRRLVSLRGRDSTAYLQGVITYSVEKITGGGFYAAFLNAKGRVLNDVFIYKDGGEGNWLIEVDAKEAGALAQHIMKYRMRAKFEARVLDVGEKSVWSVWGEEGVTFVGENMRAGIGCIDARAGYGGMRTARRVISNREEKPDARLVMDESGENVYRFRRYMIGVPEGQDEIIREGALPQEHNIDLMDGIDYHKGCYVGQELTIRTFHLGAVRKRVVSMMVYGKHGEDVHEPERLEWTPGELAENALSGGSIKAVASAEGGVKGRPSGKWLAGMGNIGLGIARLDSMGSWSNGEWISNDLKFAVDGRDGTALMVKAFPSPWLYERMAAVSKH